jgi:hypothetical protein
LSAAVDCSLNDDDDNNINLTMDLEKCVGSSGCSHLFMKAEGYCFCSLCAKPTCLECTYTKTESEICFCYKCYLPPIAVQSNDIENNMTYDEL